MAEIWRSARPVAITMRSANEARPARSSVTTASALSSSRLPTITVCNWSSREGSAVSRLLPLAGPAAAAFLRGVPGGAGSFGAAGTRAAARRRGGAAAGSAGDDGGSSGGAGGAGGFRAMVRYS